MKRRLHGSLLLASLLLLPLHASAHLVSTGLGPVYDGISHFALTPEELLPVGALALHAGLRGPASARLLLFLLPPAWLLGCFVGLAPDARLAALASALLLLAAGALLAADPRLPNWGAALLAVLFGTALGLLYGLPTGNSAPAVLGALGAAATAFAFIALLASISLSLRGFAAIVAVRVVGSWSSALGLLLVGWWIHGRS